MLFVSSGAAAPSGAKIQPPGEHSAMHLNARQSWWRSLWFRRDCRFTEIRSLMLGQLAALPDDGTRSSLQTRIDEAQHPEALWSLRHDLMAAMVAVHGEMLARRRLTDITFMFAGLLDRQRHAAHGMADAAQSIDWTVGTASRTLVGEASQLRTGH